MVRWVETDTLLRTRDELFWATLRVLGYERAGPKITPAIQTAITAVRGPGVERPALPPPAPQLAIGPPPPAPGPCVTSKPVFTSRPVAAPPPAARRAAPTAAELQPLMAVRIRYLPKTGYGGGTERIVNPLHLSGQLMWAWCHKRGDVRCFNITRISEWEAVDSDAWAPPAGAKADAERAAQSFRPHHVSRKRGRHP